MAQVPNSPPRHLTDSCPKVRTKYRERLTEPQTNIINMTEFANAPKLFNKWTFEGLEVNDISLEDYIAHKNPVYLPHTAARYAKKRFRKVQCPIVERLVCALMFHGRNSGKNF